MASETDPKDQESKIAPVQIIPLQQTHLMQKVYPLQPVILMPLNPPENDYLYLSIISFFFFILLAIPALLFSFKTREANILGDQRRAKRNSKLALSFSISSILVGSSLIISSIVVRAMKQQE